ncbi:MAG: hypothetical protein KatS3mg087_0454 [Patescibacteria group bacterium]|nr:MAG: hypothetical protein KatS3mg087_0454 [Patescibacteria group bacterium]
MSSSSIISHPFSEPTYHNGITRRTGVECRYPWSAYTGSGVPSESDIEFIHPQNPPVFEFPYPFNKPTNVPNGTPQDRVYEYDKIRFCVIVERLVGSSWQVFETIPTNSNVCFSETIYPPGIYRWHYVCQKRQNESNLSESSPYRYFRIDSSYSRVLPKRRWSTVYQLLIDNYKTQSHPVMLPDWGSKVSQAKAILASSDNDDPSTRYLLHHLFYARRPRPSSLPEWFHEDNTGVDIWTRFYRERFEGIVYSFDPDSQSNSNYSPTHRWSSSLFYDFPTRFPTWDDIVSYVNVSKQPGSNLTRLPRMLEVGSTLSSVQTRSMLPFISLCALVYVLDVTFSPSKRAQLLENIKHCVKIFFEKWFDFDSDGYIKNYIDEVSSTNDNQKMSEMASDDYNWRESFLSLALILDLLYDEFDEQFRDWFIGNLVRFWLGIARYYARSYRVRGWPPIFPVDPRIFSNKGYESHYNNYMMSVFVLGCVLAPHIKEYVRSVSELEFYHLVQESTLSYIWLNNPGFAGIEVIPSFGYRGGYHEGAPYHNWYLSTTLSFRAYMEQITLFPTLHPRVLDSLEDLHMTLWVENPRLGMGDYSHTLAIYDFNCMFAILRFTIPCFYSDGVVPDSVRKIMYNYARYFRLRTVRYTTHVDYHESVQTLITAIIRLLYTQPDFRLMDWAVHVLPPSSSDKFKVFPQTGRVYYRSSFSVNETTVSGGGVKIYSNGLDLKYKCSPYGSNSHSAEKNHHFLLSYKGYDIIGAPPRDSSIWLDARKNGFWMSMYIDAMNSNTIYAGRKIGNEVNWYRYTQQPFEMQLRAGLFPNYQERDKFCFVWWVCASSCLVSAGVAANAFVYAWT